MPLDGWDSSHDDTVDGNQKSGGKKPVEVGSENPIIYKGLHNIQLVVVIGNFWTINSRPTSKKRRVRCYKTGT